MYPSWWGKGPDMIAGILQLIIVIIIAAVIAYTIGW
jgi:hypothetical protein